MSYGDIYRYAHHNDHEHDARVNGHSAGWDHANFTDAYGSTDDTETPERFTDVADVWRDAYQEGMDDFKALENDEMIYGHDWTGN